MTTTVTRLQLASLRILLLAALAAALVGCSTTRSYVWYNELPKSEWGTTGGEYTIGVGDGLSIKVYDQEALSAAVKVRSDGRIAMTLVGEVAAAGRHPSDLAKELETRLKSFIVTPRVTVNVESAQPVSVTLVGEVTNGGTVALEPPARLLQALAKGGFTEFANRSRIFVLRQYPTFRRIRFTYDAVFNNLGGTAAFPLQTGDVIVVE